jgi:hypothetical protein
LSSSVTGSFWIKRHLRGVSLHVEELLVLNRGMNHALWQMLKGAAFRAWALHVNSVLTAQPLRFWNDITAKWSLSSLTWQTRAATADLWSYQQRDNADHVCWYQNSGVYMSNDTKFNLTGAPATDGYHACLQTFQTEWGISL